MHLTALVDSPDHVCCRYRIAAYRPFLERAGHTLELISMPHNWWERLWLYRRLRGAAVVLQRKLLPAWELALLRRAARFLIFDYDDAVFLRDSYAPRGLNHPARLRRFAATVRASDAVVAGNEFLAEHACRWAGGPWRVHHIPTCVDPSLYPLSEPTRTENGVLVWIGTASTLRGLERNAALLEEVGCRLPGLSFKVICDRFLSLRRLPVVPCPWSKATEAIEVAAADVGVSWVPADDWSRGKCALKVLQYMAAGLPVVANRVGVHGQMIRHGETGFLAETPDEWAAAIRRLLADPGLRRAMGRAGRKAVEERYALGRGAAAWLALLGDLESGAVRPETTAVREEAPCSPAST